MKRVLVFDGVKAQKRLDFCLTAVLSGGDGKGERNRETLRKEARLLTALEDISVPKPAELLNPTIGDGPDTRVLNEGAQTITLSQDDHTLLTKYLETTPWLPRASRDAVDVQDWADAAEKQD